MNKISINRLEILSKVIDVIVFWISQLFKTIYKGLYNILQKVKIKTNVSIIITKLDLGLK